MLQFYFNNHIWLIQSLKSFEKMVNLFSIHHWNLLLLLLEPSRMMWNGRTCSCSSFKQIVVTINIFMEAIATRIHVACVRSFLESFFSWKAFKLSIRRNCLPAHLL